VWNSCSLARFPEAVHVQIAPGAPLRGGHVAQSSRRQDSHGGWLATPADLVRFANPVDGFDSESNILKSDTIQQMTAPCNANGNYARGWFVNRKGNWWHTGSLPGTSTVMVRTSSGFCWAALTNTRRPPSGTMDIALDQMVWGMVRQVRGWRTA
jgi:Beta-lactamase